MPPFTPLSPLYLARGALLQTTKVWLGRRLAKRRRLERFEAYLRQTLPPRVGGPVLEVKPIWKGSNPIVCRVECDTPRGRPSLMVARCFERHMGKAKSHEHATISRILSKGGINVPDLVHADFSLQTLGRHNFEVVVEEFVQGKHPDPADFTTEGAPRLEEMAALMARLHTLSTPRAGRPWRKRRAGVPFLEDFYYRQEQEGYERVAACEFLNARAEDLRRVRAHMDARRPGIDTPGPFSLVHGDLTTANIMFRDGGDGPIALIDFGTVRYGLWPWDFVSFYRATLRNDRAAARRLLDSYLAHRPEADAEYFKRAWPYLLTWYNLYKASAATRKSERAWARNQPSEDVEFFRRHAIEQWAMTIQSLDDPGL